MYGPNEVNEVATRAYELSVRADRLLDQGDLAQAKTLMTEAAMIDGTYAVRAELLGVPDTRRVRVNPAVKKLVVPFLTDAGFLQNPLGLAYGDRIFERSRSSNTHFLFISRTKFRQVLGTLAGRYSNPSDVVYFDWRLTNVQSGALAYRTQREVEAVCTRLTELLAQWVFPWLDSR